jgi:sec-independent protein translocase protein TatC
MSQPSPDQPQGEMPLLAHFLELRDRLVRAVIGVIVLFLVLFPFANDLYVWLAHPLMSTLPEGTSMIATGVASPFLTPFRLALISAIFLAMPWLLYQLWGFIAPALYTNERRLIVPLLLGSITLFYSGMAFAYYVVFPLVFGFLTGTSPEGVTVATDITLYLDFVIKMFFAFGFAFQVPIATILFIITGMISAQNLAQKRPYIIVGAFVVGMLLTPPDVISQTLLAVPMWLLFEVGVIIGGLLERKRQAADAAAEAAAEAAQTVTPPNSETSNTASPRLAVDAQQELEPSNASDAPKPTASDLDSALAQLENQRQDNPESPRDLDDEFDRIIAQEEANRRQGDATQMTESTEPNADEHQGKTSS